VTLHNLDAIFRPAKIAVIGASDTPGNVGAAVLRNLAESGFEGTVHPVHPRHPTVLGRRAYPQVAALPERPDLAVICTPAPTVPGLVVECAELGIPGVIVISAGFREAGDEGRAREALLAQAVRRFPGLRLVGPNTVGVMVPGRKLNASFAAGLPPAGGVAFLSQSGAICTAVLDWAVEEGVGLSHVVSLGNALDVGFADLIDYLGRDSSVRAILLYVESIDRARAFMSAARAFTRTRPILAYKAGRFSESARAAASHTGAMAAEDAVFEAAFQRAGIVRVSELEDLFDCAELLAQRRVPRRPNLAIVGNAGGPGVMATDALIARHGRLAQLAPATIAALDAILPPHWPRANPVDLLGDATPERYARAAGLLLEDQGVDALLAMLTPQGVTDATATAAALATVAVASDKPVLATWMGGHTVREGIAVLNRAGIATYRTPEQAVRAFSYLIAYARNRDILYETPRDVPVDLPLTRMAIRDRFQALLGCGEGLLNHVEALELLAAYGIPVAHARAARSPEQAIEAARAIGFPVVLKVLSPQISHKTEVGGVELDVRSVDGVRGAFARIVERARKLRPDIEVEGVTVQRMVLAADGFELILGSRKDPSLGAAVLVGTGGVAAEVFGDRALGLPPLNGHLAHHMLESLRAWPLLRGYRGRPGVDLDRVIEVLLRFSYLVADWPEIREIDVNPLLATPRDVIALDARVVREPRPDTAAARPYSHLAIRPYPDELVQPGTTRDGKAVLYRPIRPEDEPLWRDMLARCSPDSIHARLGYLVSAPTHEVAARYCFLDYDREMAIVAEVRDGTERRLAGVGRLVADADQRVAEYAVLVSDDWQGRGLGNGLTDRCLEVARTWTLDRVVAKTDFKNIRMIAIFRARGFRLERGAEPSEIVASLELTPVSSKV
jgi:acetyltransferase